MSTPPPDRCPDCGCVVYYGLCVGLHRSGCPQARYPWPRPSGPIAPKPGRLVWEDGTPVHVEIDRKDPHGD